MIRTCAMACVLFAQTAVPYTPRTHERTHARIPLLKRWLLIFTRGTVLFLHMGFFAAFTECKTKIKLHKLYTRTHEHTHAVALPHILCRLVYLPASLFVDLLFHSSIQSAERAIRSVVCALVCLSAAAAAEAENQNIHNSVYTSYCRCRYTHTHTLAHIQYTNSTSLVRA